MLRIRPAYRARAYSTNRAALREKASEVGDQVRQGVVESNQLCAAFSGDA
jgi:hypothetical protein